MAGSDIALNWKGARLTYNDVALFGEGQWLNDACITFFLEHLSQKHGDAASRVLFIGAETVFWLLNEDDPEDLADAAQGLELTSKDLILCPINDNSDVTRAGGGTHWSLLVARASPGTPQMEFEHYDSVTASANVATARRFARKLASIWRPGGALGKAEVADGAASKQANSCDCGVYVLLHAEVALEAFLRGAKPDTSALSPADAVRKRQEALQVVKEAMTQAQAAKAGTK